MQGAEAGCFLSRIRPHFFYSLPSTAPPGAIFLLPTREIWKRESSKGTVFPWESFLSADSRNDLALKFGQIVSSLRHALPISSFVLLRASAFWACGKILLFALPSYRADACESVCPPSDAILWKNRWHSQKSSPVGTGSPRQGDRGSANLIRPPHPKRADCP